MKSDNERVLDLSRDRQIDERWDKVSRTTAVRLFWLTDVEGLHEEGSTSDWLLRHCKLRAEGRQ